MKKRILALMMIGVIAASLSACGAGKGENVETPAVTEETAEESENIAQESVNDDAVVADSTEAESDEDTLTDTVSEEAEPATEVTDEALADVEGTEENANVTGALPAYEYPGPETFYYAVYKYIVDEFGVYYPEADVGIPYVNIIAEDDSNPEDILVWGDFWYNAYNLSGDVLETSAGGAHPGCMHLKRTDAGYEVVKMDQVLDGSDYDPSAREIFGERYDDFVKVEGDTEARDQLRAQIIANYVAANDLSITAYKDYGWDPVTLPEENIDTFYSNL